MSSALCERLIWDQLSHLQIGSSYPARWFWATVESLRPGTSRTSQLSVLMCWSWTCPTINSKTGERWVSGNPLPLITSRVHSNINKHKVSLVIIIWFIFNFNNRAVTGTLLVLQSVMKTKGPNRISCAMIHWSDGSETTCTVSGPWKWITDINEGFNSTHAVIRAADTRLADSRGQSSPCSYCPP